MTTQHDASPAVKTASELWLVRHGETEWSKALRHTGRSDIPLTERGRRRARALKTLLTTQSFERVLASPLSRGRETAELAGYSDEVQIDEDLMEWDYGVFEGKTTAVLACRLGFFSIWNTPVPEGEQLNDVAARTDRVLEQLAGTGGRCLLFSHGQFLRILAVRWLGLAPAHGRLLAMDAGALGVLDHEHGYPIIRAWNLAGPPPWASGPIQNNCSGCHTHSGNAILPNFPLRSAPQLAKLEDFRQFVRDPRLPGGTKGPMPAFPPSKISDEQAHQLYEYITHVIETPSRKPSE